MCLVKQLTFKCPEAGNKTKGTEIGNRLAIDLQKENKKKLSINKHILYMKNVSNWNGVRLG